ncbi:MAG: PHP domain-containing protein [Candidatus Omnitrophota bacterium]
MKKYRLYIFLIIILCNFFYQLSNNFAQVQEELIQIPALVHISSTISDGKNSLEQIIKAAESSNFKAIVFTDRDFMQWEYGLWPLRKIFKKVFKQNSVKDFGFEKYIKRIGKLNKKYPGLVLIAGLETNPFYYWSGSIFSKNFSLHDTHKHMLIFGLEDENNFNQLPVIANQKALFKTFKLKDVLNFWPVLVLILALGLTRIRKKLGIFIFILSTLFLINNFPFKPCLFDQYHGDQGLMALQNTINYVREKNGLIFWAHPEAKYDQKSEYVEIITNPHSDDLMKTIDYTGFSVFYEGYKIIGCPGGLWDQLLIEAVNGKRKTPAWVIGGLAFDSQGELTESLKDLRNILLVKSINKNEILNAFRMGSLYVSRGKRSADFILNEFSICDPMGNSAKTIGQTLSLPGNDIIIKIKGDLKDNNANLSTFRLSLIKNARVIKNFQTQTPFNIEVNDLINPDESNSYYRLEIVTQGLHVITNPIFVKAGIK